MLKWCLACVAVAALGGCAGQSPDAFKDVQASVQSRAGYRVQWNQSTADDDAAGRAVVDLLKPPLSRESAVQIALLNNPNLQATYEEIGIAQADLVQAGLLKNPVFSGDFKFSQGHATPHYELAVSEDFLSILQMPLRQKIAESGLAAAKLRVSGAVLSLAAETEQAYVKLQADQQTLELRQTAERAADASAEAALQLYNAGNLNDLKLATEQAQHEQAKLDVTSAEAEVVMDRAKLAGLMGLKDEAGWVVTSRLPDVPAAEPDRAALEQQALHDRADLAALRTEGESAARSLGIAKLSWLTDADLGAAAEREHGGKWELGPSVTLPIPLFDQGQGSRARAEAELRRAQQLYAAKQIEIRAEVRSLSAKLAAARSRVVQYQKTMLPLRHRIVEQTQRQYNGMFAGVFELLQARREEIDAGREYLEALKDYWMARSELAKAVGGSLPSTTRSTTQPSNAG